MNNNLLILGIGVSIHKTDGILRFEHFCQYNNLPYKILGEGKEWKGGDMSIGTGGGQKINEVLDVIKNMDNKLLIICDTFDLFPLGNKYEIIDKFNRLTKPKQVLFSSEIYCWPDKNLQIKYPLVGTKYRFLNSGCIMGYRDDIHHLINSGGINDSDDDQLFFTQKYLNGEKIVLDRNCELFQTLGGVQDDIVIHKNRVFNHYTNSYPVFIHGNGPSKFVLNHIENYLDSKSYPEQLSIMMNQPLLIDQPKVFVALYVDSTKESEFTLFMANIKDLKYQNKIVYVYDNANNLSIKETIESMGYVYVPNIKKYQFDLFTETDCQFYFLLEQRCIITKKDILHELIQYCNGYHRVISPMLRGKFDRLFTNFWGALDENGYYARSENYIELANQKRKGLWNVPYVSGIILFSRDIIRDRNLMRYNKYERDSDMQLCFNLRKDTIFMYMLNNHNYGYLNQR